MHPNWRRPIWLPVGSGARATLAQVAEDLSRRLVRIFTLDEHRCRPVFGHSPLFQRDPRWRDLILFYKYFHGDSGAGFGASHQTGWTALVVDLILDLHRSKPTGPPGKGPTSAD
jgi:hypothetical protein